MTCAHPKLAIWISQVIEIGLDDTPSPARDWSTLPDVTSFEEMDDLFLNEARTKFIGKADREKVATMFREFSQKVVDLEYDSLPGWGVRRAEHHVLHKQACCASVQCCGLSTIAIIMVTCGSLSWSCLERRKMNLDRFMIAPPCLAPEFSRARATRAWWAFQAPYYPSSEDVLGEIGNGTNAIWDSRFSPIEGPFVYFAASVLCFALCHLATSLFYIRSPTYRARWYRCLARALRCKGLGNGPDPADFKRSAVYPRPTRRGPQTRTAGKLAVKPGKVRRGVGSDSQQVQLADLEMVPIPDV